MEENKKVDNEYYSELHGALRSYDEKIWIIPGLYLVVIGLLSSNFNFSEIYSWENLIISLIITITVFILVLFYNKATIFHISIQKKINEYDNIFNDRDGDKIRRIPLTSMDRKEFDIRINELEKNELAGEKNEGARFNFIQLVFARRQVSMWTRNTMLTTILLAFIFFILCFYKLVVKN
jgi:hypothetical protein